MNSFEASFDKTAKEMLGLLTQEMSGIRTNRPSPALVEDIKVDYFGEMLPIKQLGSIGINPPREMTITAWDTNAAPAIGKAIQNSSLALTPTVDGGVVRFQLPPLSAERREELGKLIKAIAEKIRIRLRTTRDDVNKQIASAFDAKTLSEDEKFKAKKKVQEVMDATNEAIEAMIGRKVKEIQE